MKTLSWVGSLTGILGAFVVASHVFLLGYALFTVNSVSWLIVAIRRKDGALAAMNGVYFAANLLGLYNALALDKVM